MSTTIAHMTDRQDATKEALAVAAAATIADSLPGVDSVRRVDSAEVPQIEATVSATFVGDRSVEFSIAVTDVETLTAMAGDSTALVGSADVVRPALEEASRHFGIGVLGETRDTTATAVFSDENAFVFEIVSPTGTMGWLAIHVKDTVAPPANSEPGAPDLSRINKVEMQLTVEIGRTRMSVRDVLALQPGGVVELDHAVGSPADILLNGRLIAHGEIVVVDQDYAVRVTRILDSSEAN